MTKKNKTIHPEYRTVAFLDTSNNKVFLTGSTVVTNETIKLEDGNTYPVCKVEISSASHHFFTGTKNNFSNVGAVEKFNNKYKKFNKNTNN